MTGQENRARAIASRGRNAFIIDPDDLVLVTGANGFIGSRVVETLVDYGFRNLRCFVRPSGNLERLKGIVDRGNGGNIVIIQGNLLNRDDCRKSTSGVSVIIHLAAGFDKTFPGAFLNSVVTTRNLLDSALQGNCLMRFVNVSSFAVYSNRGIRRHGLLDETCEVESHLVERYEPYTYAKAKQDELIMEYGRKRRIPYVIMRPGAVYGPGKAEMSARVGIDSFGFFMHLGGPNRIPLTYVDNCAEAIVLAGLTEGVDGQIFNVVDDNPPTSRQFLRMYKENVGNFRSIYIPYHIFYFLCRMWEKYSRWSSGQLPPAFNRWRCSAYWKGNRYSNQKLKDLLGWKPKVPFAEGSKRYFDYCKSNRGRIA